MADLFDRLLTGILHRLDLRLDLLRRAHRITRHGTALRLTLFNVPRLMSKATIGIPGGRLSKTRQEAVWPRAYLCLCVKDAKLLVVRGET